MSKGKVYLSGPMTNLPEFNYPAFHAAAAKLREHGYEVINPAEMDADTGKDWTHYMRADIKALCDCSIIALLPDWHKSRGATLELFIATQLGMAVQYL